MALGLIAAAVIAGIMLLIERDVARDVAVQARHQAAMAQIAHATRSVERTLAFDSRDASDTDMHSAAIGRAADEARNALSRLTQASNELAEASASEPSQAEALERNVAHGLGAAALALVLAMLFLDWRAVRAHTSLVCRLSQIADEDGLTGAPNRRGLDKHLPLELARAERLSYQVTVVMIDLDFFKAYNDRCGHQAGDDLLRDAVAAWRANLRSIDFLARYGGEEFTLVLPACDIDDARALVDRLRGLMPGQQSFSAGVAHWNGVESAEQLIRRADEALLRAKANGRNRTELDELETAIVA